MPEPEKTVEQIAKIKAELLDPAFDLIKNYIISHGHADPKIVSEKDSVEVSFNDKRGKVCKYSCWIIANGKIYRKVRRPPDNATDFSGCDASKVTPRRILDDFEAWFRIVI